MSSPIRIVLVTAPAGETALGMARTLVTEEYAACVNVLPGIRSVFRWNEAVDEADESLLVIKVPLGGVDALKERVKEVHPYDVPEFLVLEVTDGLPDYLRWVASSVKDRR